MSDPVRRPSSVPWAGRLVVLLLVGAALWFTASTARETSSRWRVLERKAGDLEYLRGLEAGGGGRQAARAALEALPDQEPSFVQNVAGQLLGDLPMDIQEAEPEDLGEGWMLRTVDVSIERAELERVMQLIAALEDQRPPWRLRSCFLEADADRRGWGRVVLKFETIHLERL